MNELNVDSNGIMNENDFNAVFERMSSSSSVTGEDRAAATRRNMCLWQKLQDCVNKKFHEISIVGRTGNIATVIDDDKNWCNSTGVNSKNRRNVKYTVHVRDNRRGFNIHAFTSFFVHMPMYVQVECDGSSANKCLQDGLKSLFGCDDGNDTNQEADKNFTLGGDRGYFGGGPALKTVISNGGDAFGTTKKSRELPYTDGKLLHPSDTRIVLQKDGCPCLYVSETSVSVGTHNVSRKITTCAFRNGSGGISNTISTKHHDHRWDAITVKGSDRPKENTFFSRLSIIDLPNDPREENIITSMRDHDVSVITIEQG